MWQPAIDKQGLIRLADVLARIRNFFAENSVTEVDVPLLGRSSATDPHLDAFRLSHNEVDFFLQTSPEFFMKRLLASGSGDIYSLGKAFRLEQSGRLHSAEFIMLEWYRVGYTDRELIDEVLAFVEHLRPGLTHQRYSYRDVFIRYVGLDPHLATVDELIASAVNRLDVSFADQSRNTWLDLLFSHLVEPQLQDLTVIYDYPASQCALARIVKDELGVDVARRFELFWRGKELANAYWELNDVNVQRRRFQKDLLQRQKLDLPPVAIDEKLLAALAHGLPDCAGVALGVERLMMCLFESEDIAEVQAFPFGRL